MQAKTVGEMRRSKRVRQPAKRMVLYFQDTDSDSSLQKGKGKRPARKIQKVDTLATTTKGTLEHHSTCDDEPVLAFVPSSSDESEGEPLSEREDDLRTKRKGRKRGSKKVKGRCYDHEEQERILENRKEQERKSKMQIASHDKTGPLQQTSRFVFNQADCLGKGATAAVFLARSRETGSLVAVKAYFDDSQHNKRARLREIELLRRNQHKNVMAFIEEDRVAESDQPAVILEYCAGGSVNNQLQAPVCYYGFSEEDFLAFLRDISHGLQFLNSRDIVHRDIKPDNILKRIESNGSSTYVLTDFGAARELGEDETFMSIYGTEEYIHPHMFQRGVLRQHGHSEFTASVDLWSLGVTLYHVAFGRLPFQAFGGRSDSETMYKIISERSSGEVSGSQRFHNGSIERSKELPDTSYLCRSLKSLLKPVFAGLFDPDPTRTWNFNTYFQAVSDIIDMTTLLVFNSGTCENIRLYLKNNECLVHIQEKIGYLTEIPANRQIILLGDKPLTNLVDINDQIQSFPKVVLKTTLIVYDKDGCEQYQCYTPKIPPFLPLKTSLSNDEAVAKQCAGNAFFVEFNLKQVLENQHLADEALLHLRNHYQDALKPTEVLIPEIEKQTALVNVRIEMIRESQKQAQVCLTVFKNIGTLDPDSGVEELEAFVVTDNSLPELLKKTQGRLDEIRTYMSVLSRKENDHPLSPSDDLCCDEGRDRCLTKMGHLRQGIAAVSSTFSKHRKYSILHAHEEFIHKCEREKLENSLIPVIELYQSHCVKNLTKVHHWSSRNISVFLKHLARSGKVETNVRCVTDCLNQMNEKLLKIKDSFKLATEKLMSLFATITSQTVKLPVSLRETPEGSSACERGSFNSERSIQGSKRNELLKSLFREIDYIRISGQELGTVLLDYERSIQELKSRLEMASMPSMLFCTRGETSGYGSGAPNVFLPSFHDLFPSPGIDANVRVTSSDALPVYHGAQNNTGTPIVYPNNFDSKFETHLSTDCQRTVHVYNFPNIVSSYSSNTANHLNHLHRTVNAISTNNGYSGTTPHSETTRIVQGASVSKPSNVVTYFNTTYERQLEDSKSTELIPRGLFSSVII
ncbi:serine/threonine-protein kinase TBK1-like isoform X3 [Dreissena polymorpha]|uniref:serine/threonine-protein kinase TBK1-like isoform X3 n=1 Tax=Dreissena polymorpha TaxID=45954 RepID=UPI0022642088|nr:serine/threonine-protein kinase TBK1-like isoform X3 [Dreissena polymorpha]